MANISQNIEDYKHLYDGFDIQDIRKAPSGYYKSGEDYKKKKIQSLPLGILSLTVYAGFDTDYQPLMLPIKYEQAYSTVLALNMNYVDKTTRNNIVKYVLESNKLRIENNQPIYIDWHNLAGAIPLVAGMTRRYKQMQIGVIEVYQLSNWPEVISRPSRFEGVARQIIK